MLSADVAAALVPLLPDDLLNALVKAARGTEKGRPLNGLPPWPVEAQTIVRYLEAEQRHRLRGSATTTHRGPEIGPETPDASALACWLSTESVASVLRVRPRQVSRVLPSSANRVVRDLEDRRIRRHLWDPVVVGNERLRREERR